MNLQQAIDHMNADADSLATRDWRKLCVIIFGDIREGQALLEQRVADFDERLVKLEGEAMRCVRGPGGRFLVISPRGEEVMKFDPAAAQQEKNNEDPT